jgi:hypothetical protein
MKPQVVSYMGRRSSPSSGHTSSSTLAGLFFFVVPRKVLCSRGEEEIEEEEANKFELMTLDPRRDDPGDSDDRGEVSGSSLVLWRDSSRNSMDLFDAPPSCIGFNSIMLTCP